MRTDLEVIKQVINGQQSEFSVLVERHQKLLLRLALRMTRDLELAEDIVQEAFIKAFKGLERFEGRSSFKSWIYQITANTAKNKLRSLRSDSIDIEKVAISIPSQAEKGMIEEDIKAIIQDEVELLPEKQKIALNLRIFEDLSFKEIADIMNCPYDTAKANYRHALLKLKNRMEENQLLKSWTEQEVIPTIKWGAIGAEVE